ncbi:hypothetical protein MKS61_08030 [Staphylococcus haemolyticus]|uniref:hypothetical protein n=1 Tax=Staphylococcus haemolyticus TaxID=1283 RepID=UPI001F0B5F78|nr:hypothetical protein [Staphylococcus haemolyticus]MCH4533005.1 hypothetical protein [Staphylococcus haemolyticus]
MNALTNKKEINYWLVFLPLIFTLFPSPFENSQFIAYPVIGLIIIGLVINNKHFLSYNLNSILVFILIYMVLLSILIGINILINMENTNASSLVHIFKPIFFSLILLISYLLAKESNYNQIVNSLLTMAYLLLASELVISFFQVLDINILNSIYNNKKATGIGEKLRIVGTLGNPNILAWVISQIAIIVLLFEKRKSFKIAGICLAIILIILTGSRSFTLLTPIMLIFCYLLIQKVNYKLIFFVLPMAVIFAITLFKGFIWFLYEYKEVFPYLAQITNILESGNLRSINSYDLRIGIWQNGLERMGDSWLFGIGPGIVNTMDNDYLFALVNYGAIYLIIQIILYLVIGLLFLLTSNLKFRVLGVQSLLITFVISFQADTISGWTYPFLIFFYTGILIGTIEKNETIHTVEFKNKVIKQR